MANYRQIHVSIWKDEWFLDLDTDEKLLFIYLFSNESASLAGIYKIALKVICFETGLDAEFVTAALTKFARDGKVYYQDGYIWVVNMREYNRGGETVYKRIVADVEALPNCELKRKYLEYYRQAISKESDTEQGIDTLPIPYTQPIDREYEPVVKLNEMKLNESKTLAAGAALPADPKAEDPPEATSKPLKHPERDAVIKHFLIKTGIPAPKTDNAHIKATQKRWWTPVDDILELVDCDVGKAEDLIDLALSRLKDVTVTSPQSVIETIKAVYSENHRAPTDIHTRLAEEGYVVHKAD